MNELLRVRKYDPFKITQKYIPIGNIIIFGLSFRPNFHTND